MLRAHFSLNRQTIDYDGTRTITGIFLKIKGDYQQDPEVNL